MTDAWAYEGGPQMARGEPSVTLLEGSTFCLSDGGGDVRPGAEQGLFVSDTRFVSRLELTLDGQSPEPLALRRLAPYGAAFVTRRVPRPGRADSTLLVVRRRFVGGGLVEELTLRNLGGEAAGVTVSLVVEADFAGLFEVKEGRAVPRGPVETATSPALRFSYGHDQERRGLVVEADGEPAVFSEPPSPAGLAAARLVWEVAVPSHSEWTTRLRLVPSIDGEEVVPRYEPGAPVEASLPATELAAWRRAAPHVSSRDGALGALLTRSIEDVGSLRILDPASPRRAVVAAGAPWFMTLFGRDSLLTSWMLLPLDPSLALGTLHTLGRLQGEKVDPLSEEEPGRILHEVRGGLDAGAALGGGGVYYGSVDATPLFVMLLGEARRWGAGPEEVARLLPHADRALEWIERFGDRDGDGFVEYRRATDRGLANQGWKDSFDAVTFASGRLAEPPIALAEVQAYVYGAYRARAELPREEGDVSRASDLEARAAELKARFNERFVVAGTGHVALGLDADKQQIDSVTSNMGHCLWTGILEEATAASVARHLLSPAMFSGYGVRTLSATMGAYNPMSYHNGSIWPHDNAIVARGLVRYGFVHEAHQVVEAVFAAARAFGGRLPELYCGFDRSEFDEPIPYPTSCYPQAWAAAAPLMLLRALLRLDPDVPAGRVTCDPAVPHRYLPLAIERLKVAGHTLSCRVDRHGWSLEGLPDDLELVAGDEATEAALG